ncbi:LytR/AlgR family response regulator transcription factor [Flavobacterium selenitireducens]|uniref:LytR/AlgR family response regulator transcription factor n=1 Tax=Flavobacterium selenitireducens TaxID=2722704 RepID=UPI00168B0740|nr:LytTR family DNA-binding domain-containing protein [Flavobacterium selenitireducens]MBD3582137.1 response regulator transcription factor [Flavobacterium selenitireducens]
MKHTYVIVSDNRDEIAETKAVAAVFPQLSFVGSALNFDEGLDLILEKNPDIIFLEIQPENPLSKLGLGLISEFYRYLTNVPKVIVTAKTADLAYEALRYDVLDYLLTPFRSLELRKAMLRYERSLTSIVEEKDLISAVPDSRVAELPIAESLVTDNNDEAVTILEAPQPQVMSELPIEEKPLVICVKSYGDYRFIDAKNILYLQADNNSTDIHLNSGEMITAFKTLKQFESSLPFPFVRIHNSYIVNIDYVSRIHTGNAVCYLKDSSVKLPFSKSYKENVDSIISSITNGNYLEF